MNIENPTRRDKIFAIIGAVLFVALVAGLVYWKDSMVINSVP
jgi:hypothetical protein